MSRSEFHPDLRRIALVAPRQGVSSRTLRLMRAWTRLQDLRPTPGDVEVIGVSIGAGVRLHRPVGVIRPAAGLLWIHGGGYVMGTAKQVDGLCRRFSHELGIVVASVEYRLAPEHRYPVALEDCYAALVWLAGLPGMDPKRVAIGGGGLAAALALMARDRGDVTPALQLLAYPMLDDRSAMAPANRSYRLWNPRSNQFCWTAYLGDADPQVAVPARREDLSGLAPAWIGVGTNDLFHDEAVAYSERLTQAGVPCHLEVVTGAFHGFDLLAPKVPVSQAFFASQCTGLRSALTPEASPCRFDY